MLKSIFGGKKEAEIGDALFEAITAQARDASFYKEFAVPDTVEGRFEMVALHAWLVLRRLKGNGAAAKVISQRLFDAMFSSFDAALRELGVGDLVVGKKIRKLAENFYGRAAAYDAGIKTDDNDLSQALARNIYETDEAVKADALAAYVRRAADVLDSQPLEQAMKGEIDFPKPIVS